MPKFLYLQAEEHADTWIRGGSVPINPARAYLGAVRQGTITPDEVVQKKIDGASLRDLAGVHFPVGEKVGNTTFTSCTFRGKHIPGRVQYDQYPQEALILCMCNVSDNAIMRRLEKSVGVQIDDVQALKSILDAQIGVVSLCGDVNYTNEPGNRTHFLKGVEDSWQQEYRLVWIGPGVGAERKWVELPAGQARPIQ